MKSIAKTLFYTSLISYLVFGLAEYIRPGFVSYHFSLHWFVLPMIIGAILWSDEKAKAGHVDKVFRVVVKILLNLLLFIIFWIQGKVFGDFRFIIALCALATPWIASVLLSNDD